MVNLIDCLDDGFQNLDSDTDWLDHEPEFAWTEEDLIEMEKRPLIMVVDDEEALLKLLRVNLSLDGFDVITASNGISAL